jgi:hypothetical protein
MPDVLRRPGAGIELSEGEAGSGVACAGHLAPLLSYQSESSSDSSGCE